MTNEDALNVIRASLREATNQDIEIKGTEHLKDDDIIDSLDEAVFFLELEKAVEMQFPEDVVAEKDLLSLPKLISAISNK